MSDCDLYNGDLFCSVCNIPMQDNGKYPACCSEECEKAATEKE